MKENMDQKIGVYTVIERFLKQGFALMSQTNTSGHVALAFKSQKGDDLTIMVGYSDAKPSNSSVFGKCLSWALYAKDEKREGNIYYVFVYFDKQLLKHRYFIVPNSEVIAYSRYEHQFWLDSKPSHRDNPFRAFRLGLFYEKYNHKVALVHEYEDQWDIIKT